MCVIAIQPKFVCFKFAASAKYLSRLITTFYRKSTMNITDLININDDLHYNNNLSVPRDMSKDTLNHRKPSSSRGLRPLDPPPGLCTWTPVGAYATTAPARGASNKVPCYFWFLVVPSVQKFSKNPADK